MEQNLKEGFTILINSHGEELHGTALKTEARGLIPKEINKEELKIFTILPNIRGKINEATNNLLQISYQAGIFHLALGCEKTEGPYCETEYLEIQDELSSAHFLSGLTDLETNLASSKTSETEKTYRKAYRLRSDKYE